MSVNLTWIKCQESFLSPDVKDLVALLKKPVHPDGGHAVASSVKPWSSKDCGIAWDEIEELFSGIKEDCMSKEWFYEAVVKLSPHFNHCQNILLNLTDQDCSVVIHPFLNWTRQEDEICSCLKLISKGSCSSDHLVALLSITAITERALGDLVLMKKKQVPFLLRDLLATPELQDILGKTRLQLLIVLLGSVLGLNLRNIAWHGFLSPQEVNPAHVATIIVILVDCGRFLGENFRSVSVPFRTFMSFTEASCLNSVFEDVTRPSKQVMEELISKSLLVPDIMIPVWLKALDLLNDESWGLGVTVLLPMLECSLRCLFAVVNKASHRVLTAENSTLYTTLDEILDPFISGQSQAVDDGVSDPQSEDGHRQVLKNTNNEIHVDPCLGQLRIYPSTATVEEDLPDTNKVLLVIGKKLNESLHDLLCFVQGPRVRDRVSHGEVRLGEIPRFIADHVLYLCLLVLSLGNWRHDVIRITSACSHSDDICKCLYPEDDKIFCDVKQRFCCRHSRGGSDAKFVSRCLINSLTVHKASKNLEDLVAQLAERIDKYKSIFHPNSLLHKKLICTVSQLKDWITWVRVPSTELDYVDWENEERVKLPETVSCHILGCSHKVISIHSSQELLTLIENINFDVLYRPKLELELVSVLYRITSNIQSGLDSICENLSVRYSQYTDKKLRSRQRETYRRQLNAVPVVILNCYLTLQVVCLMFSKIDNASQLSKSCFSRLIKNLKVILKIHENIVSQTNLGINRWDEAFSISVQNITTIRDNFSS